MSDFRYKRKFGPTPKYDLVECYRHPHSGFVIIGGPCFVESHELIDKVAFEVALAGGTHLRGGIFRAGTYPPKNFGMIDLVTVQRYHYTAKLHGLQNIIEVLDYRDIPILDPLADCFQIGARGMQQYTLLKEVGRAGKPVFLKRHPGAKLDEWLGAAEYVLQAGCKELYLIERGSVSHVDHVRWDLSISMIPAVRAISHIPVIVDGSHGTGRRDLVKPMTLAGVAAGARGVLVETHPDPDNSLSDSEQALPFKLFHETIEQVNAIRRLV